MKKGIDISKWQGFIDFPKVKAAGIEFVIVRSSYRQTVDPMFYEYVKGCRESDIPVLGIYHFLYALNEQQALAEAEFCVEQAKLAGLNKDTYIFSDFEYDTVEKAAASGVILTKNECNNFTRIFCEYVKSQGYKAGIYSNIDYYKNWYDHELLSKYHYWLADYNGGPDYSCLIQQFTSSGKVNGINGNVDMNYYYDTAVDKIKKSRQAVVDLVISWEGKNEDDGSHKSIIDIYNSYNGLLPRGTKMKYEWAWCACTWSALAIKLGYVDIMPIEISCEYLIEAAKKMRCWRENDEYIAKPGDAVLYDWDDTGNGDNASWADHIGVVIETHVDAGYFVVMEGNYGNAVKKRMLLINGRYIRGFITPKYDDDTLSGTAQIPDKDVETVACEVIAGIWGNGETRRDSLETQGYNYDEVQSMVNRILNDTVVAPNVTPVPEQPPIKKITATCYARNFDEKLAGEYETTANLYMRNDAGTNKKALCIIPQGETVQCYGYHSIVNGVKWLYIQVSLEGVQYTGFSSSNYLKR